MKKKGYALLMAIVSIGIVATLAAAVSSLALASYRNAANENKRNQLRLKAENGIEIQINYIKEYILDNFTAIYLNNNTRAVDLTKVNPVPDEVNPPDGINRKLTMYDTDSEGNSTYEDPKTGRKVNLIRIVSTCQFTDGTNPVGRSLTVEVIMDRSTIYNEYFERIFNKASFTTAPTDTGPTDSSFKINGHSLETSGSVFLQGKVDFSPTPVKFNEGEIKVKVPIGASFNTNIVSANSGELEELVSLSKDVDISGTWPEVWKDKNMTYLPMCNIIPYQDSGGKSKLGKMQTIDSTAVNTAIDESVIDTHEPKNPGDPELNLVTYKVKTVPGKAINFQELIDGADLRGDSDDSLYFQICKILKVKHPTDFLIHFKDYYKVILIDGDLKVMEEDFRIYNNYILYVTGKVTLNKGAEFYNSSIFAKEIEISGDVIFHGVNTQKSIERDLGGVDGLNLEDFNPTKKNYLNAYFIDNLEYYGDYLKFNKLFWNEY